MDIKDCKVGMEVKFNNRLFNIVAVGKHSVLVDDKDGEYCVLPKDLELPQDTFDLSIQSWYKDNILSCLLHDANGSYVTNRLHINLKGRSNRLTILKQLNELLKRFEKEGRL